jgi:hypothetical protein
LLLANLKSKTKELILKIMCKFNKRGLTRNSFMAQKLIFPFKFVQLFEEFINRVSE